MRSVDLFIRVMFISGLKSLILPFLSLYTFIPSKHYWLRVSAFMFYPFTLYTLPRYHSGIQPYMAPKRDFHKV
jgi:hypothetical protein